MPGVSGEISFSSVQLELHTLRAFIHIHENLPQQRYLILYNGINWYGRWYHLQWHHGMLYAKFSPTHLLTIGENASIALAVNTATSPRRMDATASFINSGTFELFIVNTKPA
jgi:hypothetical protein